MTQKNLALIEHFELIGKLFAAKQEHFKSRAFINGAKLVKSLKVELSNEDDITVYDGVGSAIQNVAMEFIKTGNSAKLKMLMSTTKSDYGTTEFTDNEKALLASQGILTVKEAQNQLRLNKLDNESIARKVGYTHHLVIGNLIQTLITSIDPTHNGVDEHEDFKVCGSYLRDNTYCRDLDIVYVGKLTADEIEIILAPIPDFIKIRGADMKTRLEHLPTGVGIDLIYPREGESIATHTLYFTGPMEFNVKCRAAAKMLGYRLNEHGLFIGQTHESVHLNEDTEEEILRVIKVGHVLPNKRN